MSSSHPKLPKPRSRTFTGCFKCRARKVKCDLGRPNCGACQRLRLCCEYDAGLSWVSALDSIDDGEDTKNGEGRWRTRMEVFSTCEREQESSRLVKSLAAVAAGADVGDVLERLDDEADGVSRDLAGHPQHQLTAGPYSVFALDANQTLVPLHSPNTDHDASDDNRVDLNESLPLFGASPVNLGTYEPVGDQPFDQFTDSAIMFEAGQFGSFEDPTCPNDFISVSSAVEEPHVFHGLQSQSPLNTATSIQSEEELEFVRSLSLPRLSSGPKTSPFLPTDVRFLLSHYSTHVIDSLSAVPLKEKAPWRGLHLSSALSVYGELDVLGTSSLPGVSLLYSLLSLTCFHLNSMYAYGNDPLDEAAGHVDETHSQKWMERAHHFRKISRTAFRKHLEAEASQPSYVPKYKELLMAAMSLLCVSIIGGDVWDSRLYILQCEKIIREIGTSKQRLSHKALQLHRLFTFISIVERTTFCQQPQEYQNLLRDNNFLPSEVALIKDNACREENTLVLSSPIAETRLTTLELRLDVATDLELDNICGIPGRLFDLLSKTTALIETISARTLPRSTQYTIPIDLLNEAAALEQTICNFDVAINVAPSSVVDQWNASFTGLNPSATRDMSVFGYPSDIMAYSMRSALYNALLVYFFREVRNTNPKILQHYVEKVIVCLETHHQVKSQHFPMSRIGLVVWPSFIVACEALGSTLRRRAIACIRHAFAAGFRNGQVAETVVREIWRQRDGGNTNVSWREIVSRSRTFMLLT